MNVRLSTAGKRWLLRTFARAYVRCIERIWRVRLSEMLDAEMYLREYPDVGESGLDADFHYLRFGAKEGRRPHPAFDTEYYLAAYPDVARAGINPLVHYLRFGRVEGRLAQAPKCEPDRRRPISVLIPTYGAADSLWVCLESLAGSLPERASVYVLDDGTPDASVADAAAEFAPRFPRFRYIRYDTNQGFVRTCNRGLEDRDDPESDVLLLNSDTKATEGFLDEMQAVLELNERHAVVCPRSNDATLFSVPVAVPAKPEEAYEIWQSMRPRLPRFHVVPTAVGFCMLVRNSVLTLFGLFDEVYGAGYNEENDFVCRINRFGFSAVAANHAFVYHFGSASFGSRRFELEEKNRRVLLERYPEYERKVAEYFEYELDPVEYFASLALPHRPRILVHLLHMPDRYCGTSEFALRLLENAVPLLEAEYDVYVATTVKARSFFGAELDAYRSYDEARDGSMAFDLVYRPCQLYSWQEFSAMNRMAPRVCFTLLDIIGARCDYISSAGRREITRSSVELSDRVFSISAATKADFEAFYATTTGIQPILLAGQAAPDVGEGPQGDHVLVVGNTFDHKALAPAIKALNGSGRPMIILGEAAEADSADYVRCIRSGELSRDELRSLYEQARVVAYPSQYEGFGLPIVEAVQYGKPVVAFDTGASRELAPMLPPGRLVLVSTFEEMKERVEDLSWAAGVTDRSVSRTWADVAREYREAFAAMLRAEINVELMRRRWRHLRAMKTAASDPGG